MTDFDLIGAAGVAVISSYLTLYVTDEVKPKINEDGEYKYSLPGYLVMVGATLIKWSIRKIMGLFGVKEAEYGISVEDQEVEFETESLISKHELLI